MTIPMTIPKSFSFLTRVASDCEESTVHSFWMKLGNFVPRTGDGPLR